MWSNRLNKAKRTKLWSSSSRNVSHRWWPPWHVELARGILSLLQVVIHPAGDWEERHALLDHVLLPTDLDKHALHLVGDLFISGLLVACGVTIHLIATADDLLHSRSWWNRGDQKHQWWCSATCQWRAPWSTALCLMPSPQTMTLVPQTEMRKPQHIHQRRTAAPQGHPKCHARCNLVHWMCRQRPCPNSNCRKLYEEGSPELKWTYDETDIDLIESRYMLKKSLRWKMQNNRGEPQTSLENRIISRAPNRRSPEKTTRTYHNHILKPKTTLTSSSPNLPSNNPNLPSHEDMQSLRNM